MKPFRIDGVDGELTWENAPRAWEVGVRRLAIVSGDGEDWFIDPADRSSAKRNAPCAFFRPISHDFVLSANVKVDFQQKYDAGAIHVRVQDDLWAKLCFEYSSFVQPTIVSVVTRGTSDDCNSTVIDGDSVYLRVSKVGATFAFHYSLDGAQWNLVRYFDLNAADTVRPGFSAQAPVGTSCSAWFSHITYAFRTIGDIRSGE